MLTGKWHKNAIKSEKSGLGGRHFSPILPSAPAHLVLAELQRLQDGELGLGVVEREAEQVQEEAGATTTELKPLQGTQPGGR